MWEKYQSYHPSQLYKSHILPITLAQCKTENKSAPSTLYFETLAVHNSHEAKMCL
jgi:hypothetical protein